MLREGMLIYLCLYSDEVLFHANYFEIIRTQIQFEPQGHQISRYRNLRFSLTEFMLVVGAQIAFFWVTLLLILIENVCYTGCCIWLMVYSLHLNIFPSFSDGQNYTSPLPIHIFGVLQI